jgi:anti-sigma regulatory factor (Ser/Thr protein kinase)
MQLLGLERQRRHVIRDGSAIGEARRESQRLAAHAGFDETLAGRVGVVATELATNVLRHGGGGELLVQALPTDSGISIELLAVDRGPGIADVERCLQDGYSTAGSAGTGLGAVRRLSAEFDIYSERSRGTAVLSRVGSGQRSNFGAVCTPKDGETECGDTWRAACLDGKKSLVVVDGLGHGLLAAEAAQLAAEVFQKDPFVSPQALIERMHRALSGTRGAAGACVQLNGDDELSYAGIGNIAGRVCTADSSRGLVSHSGTLGFQARRVQQFAYPRAQSSLLVMHSDGLSARWDLAEHVGLHTHHPALIAGVLYRDHSRGRDDATVVVYRE